MTLRQKYDAAVASLTKAQTDLAVCQTTSAAKDQTIGTLEGQVTAITTERDKAAAKVTDLTAQVTALTDEVADLQAQLDALQPPDPEPTAKVELGAWAEFNMDGNSSLAEQQMFDDLSGVPMKASMMYAPFSVNGQAYAFAPTTGIQDAGRWVHWAWGNPPAGTNLATWVPDMAAGKYDALFTQTAGWCRDHALRGRFQLRPFWEMTMQAQEWNATHYGNKPEIYVQMWQRMGAIFRSVAPDVELVWSPPWHSAPNETWNAMAHYYPGDEYVDRIGVEPYNNFGADAGTTWRSWEQLAAETVAFADGRPMMMTEGGCLEDKADPTRKAKWITDMGEYVKTLPNFKELLWFHRGGKDFRVNTTPQSLAAWQALCADPYFGGGG